MGCSSVLLSANGGKTTCSLLKQSRSQISKKRRAGHSKDSRCPQSLIIATNAEVGEHKAKFLLICGKVFLSGNCGKPLLYFLYIVAIFLASTQNIPVYWWQKSGITVLTGGSSQISSFVFSPGKLSCYTWGRWELLKRKNPNISPWEWLPFANLITENM